MMGEGEPSSGACKPNRVLACAAIALFELGGLLVDTTLPEYLYLVLGVRPDGFQEGFSAAGSSKPSARFWLRV
jgi:hypothetical protein